MFFIGRCRVGNLFSTLFLFTFCIFTAEMKKKKIIVAITGASGAIYAKLLLDNLKALSAQIERVGVVMSDNAREVWRFELGHSDYEQYPFDFYSKMDFHAPFASGSAKYDTMIIIPCSMGTLGRIAQGISNDLISRGADVILKERRKLIAVVRDTPFSLIHLNNMKTVTEAGGIICPANPSFYSIPVTIEDVAQTVVSRVIDLAGLEQDSYRWSE
ncbi:4-hydroxy-3-polyprenylbenzoate decarboxylase [Pedobacter duraquae]|uniref:Flavin prenyltransferase UbiX n=2 Tax=Pedobacter duraquae TaxID=425511 RepID=A0A4R6IKM0_9SPHI|nr:4-hydroxy-3-polyprenylbenzoate decarboxylase [Pedobacter duraquae]